MGSGGGGRARHTEFGEPRRLVVGGRVEGLLERSQFDAVVFVGVPILWVIRTRAVIFRWFPLVFLSAVGKIHLGLGPEVKVHRQKIILGGFLADVEGEEGYNKEGDAADDVDEASVGNGLESGVDEGVIDRAEGFHELYRGADGLDVVPVNDVVGPLQAGAQWTLVHDDVGTSGF